ncbi:acyltransferase [Vibrio sp. F13]|uniref:acyltransferase n=1 Tax=unclassified Vibrio TaxID=2614977 RepID=UPI0010BD92AF|nr:acyltransferase [Vibrio sp. F13]TKF44873.1 acyltransferase [Vibrio sp. F13]TKF54093.1 acyltransferase [Vibrio sp. F13]TKF73146.1 acyltransferase [Vibrio sp. F13]TKG07963.1 acyltransferase [Vibrio sp. F13]
MLDNLRMALNVLFVTINTAFTALAVSLFALIKLILPISVVQKSCTRLANFAFWCWASLNLWMLNANNDIEWQVEGGEDISTKQWYLMMSNHLSWADIVILSSILKDKMPMTKYFLKHELLYVPFVGLACWGLDMPFMRRHSREFLLRNPERRNDDFNAINKACTKFKLAPTTLVNFVEGTRANHEKLASAKTPYRHLLKPKTGGVAFALSAMGPILDGIVDVTLAYPENQTSPFEDMLKGKMTKVVVRIKLHPMDENVNGNYFEDKAFKRRFHNWLNSTWKEKDVYLDTVYGVDKPSEVETVDEPDVAYKKQEQ